VVWPGARARFLSEVTGPHFEVICRTCAITADPAVFGGLPGGVGSEVVADPANRTRDTVLSCYSGAGFSGGLQAAQNRGIRLVGLEQRYA
jgi:hypothetical protein